MWHRSVALASAAFADQPLEVLDQRGNRALDDIEHLGVRARRPSRWISQIFVPWHGERVPSTQQLNLHRFDGGVETSSRFLPTAKPLEVRRGVTVHGDDEVRAGEIVGMDLPPDMSDVIAAQSSLVGGQRVRQCTDVRASGRCGIE